MNTVGPKRNTPTTSTMLRTEFASLMRFMPLLTPRNAEIAANRARAAMTRTHTARPGSRPVNVARPEVNCMTAKPKEVARPRTVAMIASNSTITPAGRCRGPGRMSTVASRKVSVLPRLWWEYARQMATMQYMAQAVRPQWK